MLLTRHYRPKDYIKEVESVETVDIPNKKIDYSSMTVTELRKEAKSRGLEGYSDLKKAELIELLG